jgi:hypothetical protein
MAEDGLLDDEPVLKKKIKEEKVIKERKKHDRFNGMPEEEVSRRTLPDHLAANLDIVIVSCFVARPTSALVDIRILCVADRYQSRSIRRLQRSSLRGAWQSLL